jgi:serine/threonine protein kinase
MGIVYQSLDASLCRPVAIKVLRSELADERARARFLREARAAARLRHEHVVRVYAVDQTADGLPYLVMEYVAGPTLAAHLRGHRLGPQEVVALLVQVADALAAAHAAGLIHRDVKPGNVLLEPATGGRFTAKLTDFGLARDAGSGGTLTAEGDLAGTPAYMSPEQARGAIRLDPRTDVYGLGATLYEALTGEAPFRGTPALVLHQVLHEEPPPPRRLNDGIPRDLETICLKAMAKEPGRRYPTAQDLAADLRRFLRGEPIVARPASRVERLGRWCRRNPRVAVLSAALLAVAIVGFLSVVWQWRRAEQEHQLAEARFRDAVGVVDQFHTLVSENRLLNEPGMQPLRKQLLTTARDYYARFAHERRNDPTVQVELGRALFRLGSITWDIEAPDEALPYFQQALQIQEPLARRRPVDLASQADLAHTLNNLGNVYLETWQSDQALDVRFRSLELSQHLVEQFPAEPAGYEGLFRTYHNLGLFYHGSGLETQAEEAYRQSAAAARRLADDHPQEPLYRINQLATLLYLAQLYREAGRLGEATKLLEQATPLARDCPEYPGYQHIVACHTADRAILQALAAQAEPADRGARQLAEAETQLQAAVQCLRRLTEADPQNTTFRLTLAIDVTWAGRLNQALGRTTKAEGFFREARASTEKLTREYPHGLTFQFAPLPARLALAALCSDAGLLAEALDTCDRARAVLALGPVFVYRHAYFGPLLRPISFQRALARCERGRFEEALADWDDLLAEDAGKYKLRLASYEKRFDWDRVLADGTGKYRHLWSASQVLTQARRDGRDPAPLLRDLYVQASTEAEAYQQLELLSGSACWWFALINGAAAAAAAADDRIPSAERERTAERCVSRAIALLRRAHRAGYFQAAGRVEHMRQVRELAAVRDRPEGAALLRDLAAPRSGVIDSTK